MRRRSPPLCRRPLGRAVCRSSYAGLHRVHDETAHAGVLAALFWVDHKDRVQRPHWFPESALVLPSQIGEGAVRDGMSTDGGGSRLVLVSQMPSSARRVDLPTSRLPRWSSVAPSAAPGLLVPAGACGPRSGRAGPGNTAVATPLPAGGGGGSGGTAVANEPCRQSLALSAGWEYTVVSPVRRRPWLTQEAWTLQVGRPDRGRRNERWRTHGREPTAAAAALAAVTGAVFVLVVVLFPVVVVVVVAVAAFLVFLLIGQRRLRGSCGVGRPGSSRDEEGARTRWCERGAPGAAGGRGRTTRTVGARETRRM